jgi:hypothetical protein
VSTVWNPSDKTTNISLSNTNHTGSVTTNTSTNEGVRAVGVSHGASSGKWYLEFSTILSARGSGSYGCAAFGDTLGSSGQLGVDPGGTLHVSTNSIALSSSPDGHTLGIAIDLVNNLVWATLDGVNWSSNGATGNPATGTGGVSSSGVTLPIIPYMWQQAFGPGHSTLNCGDNAFTFTLPAGFLPWDAPPPKPTRSYATVMS